MTRLKSLNQLEGEITRLQALHHSYTGQKNAKRRHAINAKLKKLAELKESYNAPPIGEGK